VAEIHESAIRELTPAPDGARRIFYASTPYRTGTLRFILNGYVYPPDDERWGYTETSDTSIELTGTHVPRASDKLQYFAQDRDGSAPSELDNVVGSPFDPAGVLP
jgi:hypothetical protein